MNTPSETPPIPPGERLSEAEREALEYLDSMQKYALGGTTYTAAIATVCAALRCLATPSGGEGLVAEEMTALRRFAETAEDDHSFDVPQPMMSTLAQRGAVMRGSRRGWYYLTDYGRWLLASKEHCGACGFTMSGIGRCVNCAATPPTAATRDWKPAIAAAKERHWGAATPSAGDAEAVAWVRVKNDQYEVQVGGNCPHNRGSGFHGPWIKAGKLTHALTRPQGAATLAPSLLESMAASSEQVKREEDAAWAAYSTRLDKGGSKSMASDPRGVIRELLAAARSVR